MVSDHSQPSRLNFNKTVQKRNADKCEISGVSLIEPLGPGKFMTNMHTTEGYDDDARSKEAIILNQSHSRQDAADTYRRDQANPRNNQGSRQNIMPDVIFYTSTTGTGTYGDQPEDFHNPLSYENIRRTYKAVSGLDDTEFEKLDQRMVDELLKLSSVIMKKMRKSLTNK